MGDISSKNEMEHPTDLLCLDAYPSDATRLFFEELKQRLKGITLIPVREDDLLLNRNNTAPVLIICNNALRLMSDIQWIKNLPRRDGKTILLILHCTTVDKLPLSSQKPSVQTKFPVISETVEIGFDFHAPWYRKGIYGCQKNDEALKLIKNIASTKTQPKTDVDLLVILRCSNMSKASEENTGMTNTETLIEASKFIHKYVKDNCKCIIIQGARSFEEWNRYQKPKMNISQTNDGSERITIDEEEFSHDKISALAFKCYLESQTCKTVGTLLANGIHADMVPLLAPVQSKQDDGKTLEFEFSYLLMSIKNEDVPVLIGAYVDDSPKGCRTVNVNEDAMRKELSKKFNFHHEECFPSETATCSSSSDIKDTDHHKPVSEHRENENQDNRITYDLIQP